MSTLSDFQNVSGLLLGRGLVDLYSGAVSIRTANGFAITRSGAFLAGLEESDLIECPLEGAIRDDGDVKPVTDAIAIQAIYHMNPNTAAILRVHPPHVMALASSLSSLEISDAEGRSVLGPRIPVLTVVMDQVIAELHEKVPALIEEGNKVIVVKGFGAFAASPTWHGALRALCALETSARIQWLIRSGSPAPVRPAPPPHSSQGGYQNRRNDSQGSRTPYSTKSGIPQGLGAMDRRSPGGYPPRRDNRNPRRFPR